MKDFGDGVDDDDDDDDDDYGGGGENGDRFYIYLVLYSEAQPVANSP